MLVSCGNGVLQVPLVIEHGHSEHHMFVIQILKQVLAVGVADVSWELEAGVQKSVGVVAHQHGIPVVGLAVAPRAAAQAAANWRTAFRYAAIACGTGALKMPIPTAGSKNAKKIYITIYIYNMSNISNPMFSKERPPREPRAALR